MTPHGFYTAIAGARQKGGTGSYPLMARGADRFIGWHPHAYRHEAYQLAVQAATNLQSNDPGFFPHVHPHEFAKAIVGHHLVTDVGAVYRDLDRQSLCRAVVDEMWRVLYDEGVLRRGPDIDRVRRAREQRDALLVTLDGILATILDREAKAERAAGRASNGRDKQRRLELKLQAAEHRLDANGRRDDLRRFQESLEQAELELEAAQTTLVPIPEYVSDAEHARSFADALGQSHAGNGTDTQHSRSLTRCRSRTSPSCSVRHRRRSAGGAGSASRRTGRFAGTAARTPGTTTPRRTDGSAETPSTCRS